MNAQALILPLLLGFVHCFTAPGFAHFCHFVLAHMALLGLSHCVTETLRLTGRHHVVHWTTPYAFLHRGRWACQQGSQGLLDLIVTVDTGSSSVAGGAEVRQLTIEADHPLVRLQRA